MAERLQFILKAKDEFSSILGSAARGFGALGAAGAAAGATILALTTTTAKAYDEVGKFSQRIGVSTEALSELHHAAELSGVSQQNMNLSLQRMTRRVAEAAQGLGEAKGALDEMGISAENLTQLAPDEQFMKVADALSEVDSQSDKVRLAFKLFDSEGVGVLQMLADGTEGLEAMREEAEKFGLVVSGQAAGNAAEFNDSLTRIWGSIRGVKNAFSEEFMPVFTGVFNRVADIIADNRDKFIEWTASAGNAMLDVGQVIAEVIAFGLDTWKDWGLIWDELKITWLEMKNTILEGVGEIMEGAIEMMRALDVNAVLADSIAEAEGSLLNLNRGIRDNNAEIYEITQEIQQSLQDGFAMDAVEEQFVRLRGLITDLREEGTGDIIDPTGRMQQQLEEKIALTQQEIDTMQQLYDQYYISEDERLLNWYLAQQDAYAGHREQLQQLDQIYAARQRELDLQNAEILAQQQQEEYDRRQTAMSDFYDNLQVIGESYGRTAFNAVKAINIAVAIMDTYKGAQSAFSSMAGIPIVGPALGTAAAAAAVLAGLARVRQIRAQEYGSAHAGLTSVPEDATYALKAGERVVQPEQNRDLTNFLADREGGGGGAEFNITLFPNATNVQAMLQISREDWEEIVADRIQPALVSLGYAQ